MLVLRIYPVLCLEGSPEKVAILTYGQQRFIRQAGLKQPDRDDGLRVRSRAAIIPASTLPPPSCPYTLLL